VYLDFAEIGLDANKMKHYPTPITPESKIVWNDSLQAWLLWQYEDVAAALQDDRLSAVSLDGKAIPEAYPKETHQQHRQQFIGLLQQNKEGIGEIIADSIQQYCDRLKVTPTWALQKDLIKPCCQQIALTLLDFEAERLPELQAAADAVFYMGKGDEAYEAGIESTLVLAKYFQEKISLRLQKPGKDLLSDYLQNKAAADVWLSHLLQFWVGCCTSLPLLLGNIVLALSQDETQKAAYLEKPNEAVSELLRYAGPSQWVFRSVAEVMELGGHHFEVGERLALLLSRANRDSRVFEQGDALQLGCPAGAHLSLGRGMHACLGASLIRGAAAQIPAAIFRAFPTLSLDYSSLQWGGSGSIEGVLELNGKTLASNKD